MHLELDGEITLMGSANMDRRSFDLNFENNILFYDPPLSQAVRQRQQTYIDSARQVTKKEVAGWSRLRSLRYNTVAMLGPLL